MQRQLTQVAVPKVSSHGEKSCVSAGVRCVEPRLERPPRLLGLFGLLAQKGCGEEEAMAAVTALTITCFSPCREGAQQVLP